jgi:hypothetical protein
MKVIFDALGEILKSLKEQGWVWVDGSRGLVLCKCGMTVHIDNINNSCEHGHKKVEEKNPDHKFYVEWDKEKLIEQVEARDDRIQEYKKIIIGYLKAEEEYRDAKNRLNTGETKGYKDAKVHHHYWRQQMIISSMEEGELKETMERVEFGKRLFDGDGFFKGRTNPKLKDGGIVDSENRIVEESDHV